MITEHRTSALGGAFEYRIEMLIRRGELDSVEKCHIELLRMAKVIDDSTKAAIKGYMRTPAQIHDDLYAAGATRQVVDQKPVAIHHDVEIEPAAESALDTFAAKAGIVGGQGRTGGEMVASALYVLGGLALLAGGIVAVWVMS